MKKMSIIMVLILILCNLAGCSGKIPQEDKNYNAGQYYSHVFNACKYKNGLYTLPINYSYMLWGSDVKVNADDRQWNWQDFLKAAENAVNSGKLQEGNNYLLEGTDENLFDSIFNENYNILVNENKKSFDSKGFIHLLTLCQDLSDKKVIRKQVTMQDVKPPLLQNVFVDSVYSLASTETSKNPVKHLYRRPSENKGKVRLNTYLMLAINDASQNQNTAWEFLKLLISDDMQSSPSLPGLPINKSAFKQKVDKETTQLCQETSLSLSEAKALMQKYTRFNESITQDFTYTCTDKQIRKIVREEAHPFFAGNATAKDVAQRIENKVSIYLRE